MKILIIALFFFFIASGCANRSAPGGGPVDRTPPEIVYTVPAGDSIHVPNDLPEIKIEFSERMDEGSLSRAVFISPPLDYTVSWSKGKMLFLELGDTLITDQTYVVSVGTDATDEHNNKLSQSFQFAFSTGGQIDRGSISGRVFGLSRNEQAHIFGYPVRDSIDFKLTQSAPLYVTQSGVDANYSLKYLKPDRYRILAVTDQNNNLKIDANYELVGLPYRDVSLSAGSENFVHLNFQLTRMDTTAPTLSGARAINRNYIQIRFSEPVEMLSDSGFAIIDSLTQDTLSVYGFSANAENPNNLDVYTESMDSAGYYQIITRILRDTSGVVNRSEMKISFPPKMNVDTTHFTVVEFTPADSVKNIMPDGIIALEFSNPVQWNDVFINFRLQNSDSIHIHGSWEIESVTKGLFRPDEPLTPDSSYHARLNSGGIHNLWGNILEDSTISRYFTLISARELGEIAGAVQGFKGNDRPVYLTARLLDRKNTAAQIKINSDGPFLFNHLPEGQYKIYGFWDLDQNGFHSPGNLFPYQFAEPFFMLADTIKVRKRWESKGNLITLPDLE